jgi:2-C-methyl-D-erythritol 4-phosphate cytidylyltransferase
VIAAAGSGTRLGAGGPKALVEVAGRPLIAWSLDAFERADSVALVVIAAPPGHEKEIARVAPDAVVVTGADSRSASVAAALARAESDVVAVHDAARPCVTAALIDALVARLLASAGADAVIAAAPLTDTVKRAHEARTPAGAAGGGGPAVAGTESRDHLWAAQTPQVFRTSVLREALAGDPERIAAASDDAMLVEAQGGTVLIEAAPTANLKVTTPDDLTIAAALLRRS